MLNAPGLPQNYADWANPILSSPYYAQNVSSKINFGQPIVSAVFRSV